MNIDSRPPEVPGFQLHECLGEGGQSVVYRATRDGEQTSFALKVAKLGGDIPDAERNFVREAASMARIRHPGVARIMEVGQLASGTPYLVMELVSGSTVREAMPHGTMPEPTLIAVGRSVAAALSAVHRQGMVHLDVKPANLLLDGENVRLIDFGIVREAGKLTEVAAGTYPYSAPEQLGVIRKPIDGRADLYALGATLYHCATGNRPFDGLGGADLLAAKKSFTLLNVREINSRISPALGALIARLVATDPDDRLLSADAAVAAFDALDAMNEAIAQGRDPWELVDRAALSGPPFIGRERELDRLRKQWTEAQAGQGAVVLIEGESGGGKSRLARMLVNEARRDGALMLEAKCSEGEQSPLGPLRDALTDFALGAFRLPAREQEARLDLLREATRGRAHLIGLLSPLLARVLGVAGAAKELEGGQKQLHDAVVDVLAELSERAPAVVLLLDDVQWLDRASQQVLQLLSGRASSLRLLVLSTARNDVRSSAALEQVAAAVNPARVPLGPLEEREVARLIWDHLGATIEPDASLVQAVWNRSQGSPFAVGEILRTFIDLGLLRPSWGRWLLDVDGLERVALPEDVVRLVVRRLDGLHRASRATLALAAVIGARFDAELLAAVAGEAEVNQALTEGLQSNLLERIQGTEYRFTHDRLREALQAELDAGQQRDAHQRIADALEALPTRTNAVAFSLAHHLGRGHPDRDPARFRAVNLIAGQRALDAFANEEALRFLTAAQELDRQAGRTPDVSLDTLLGHACARLNRSAEAIEHYSRAVASTQDARRRSFLHEQLARVHMSLFDTERASLECERALRDLNAPVPTLRLSSYLRTLLGWLWGFVSVFRGQATGDEQVRLQAIARIYEVAGMTSYYANLPLVYAQIGVRLRHLVRKLPPSRELVQSWSSYAIFLSILGLKRRARRYAHSAVELAETFNDRIISARARFYELVVRGFTDLPLEEEELGRALLKNRDNWLPDDVLDSAYGALTWSLLLRGRINQAWALEQEHLARSEQAVVGPVTDEVHHHPAHSIRLPLLTMLGRVAETAPFLANVTRLAQGVDYTSTLFWSHRFCGLWAEGAPAEQMEAAIAQFRRPKLAIGLIAMHHLHFFVCQAYYRLYQCDGLTREPADPTIALRELKRALGELKQVSKISLLKCHFHICRSGYLRRQGKRAAAWRALDRAERLAATIDAPGAWAEICAQRAELCRDSNEGPSSTRYAQHACEVALQQGMVMHERRWAQRFGLLVTGSAQSSKASTLRSIEMTMDRLPESAAELDSTSMLPTRDK